MPNADIQVSQSPPAEYPSEYASLIYMHRQDLYLTSQECPLNMSTCCARKQKEAFDALAVTAQVDVSKDGPSGKGAKRGRDAGGCSTGQTHTQKSRRISLVGSDSE